MPFLLFLGLKGIKYAKNEYFLKKMHLQLIDNKGVMKHKI